MLCVLYFSCTLFLFFVVTVCECHIEIKGYLLTYLDAVVRPYVKLCSISAATVIRVWRAVPWYCYGIHCAI